jgi:pyruvate-formate lyase-activating enzyme
MGCPEDTITQTPQPHYGLRSGAEEFPLMVIISLLYYCNFGCPKCPYTEANSDLRLYYKEHNGLLLPEALWNKLADECGTYGAWMRCTGGGEPMLHPRMTEMVEYAKRQRARVWMNTNGSLFGTQARLRENLERLLRAGIDLIEFSMDAGDSETYAKTRPPHQGESMGPEERWQRHVDNVRAALELRRQLRQPSRIVVSLIRQDLIAGKLDEAVRFWMEDVGVDEVITRKFLTWDDNTKMGFGAALDPHLYASLPTEKKEPCVWPFERLNVDTLGQIALCGQDISFRTASLFPNAWKASLKDIWRGERFSWYRRLHLEGLGAEAWPCRGCSAWKAGIRDWQHGWLKVLTKSGQHVREILDDDLGQEVKPLEPEASKEIGDN